MTDRNGVEVRPGDRVMVFDRDRFDGYGQVTTVVDCSCGRPECHFGGSVALALPGRRQGVGGVAPYRIELPVVAAIARGREP